MVRLSTVIENHALTCGLGAASFAAWSHGGWHLSRSHSTTRGFEVTRNHLLFSRHVGDLGFRVQCWPVTTATETTSELEFSVVFNGPALRSGRMPVTQLAPALLALGEIFQDANARINPGQASVELDFQAVRPGSFHTLLVLSQVAAGGQAPSLLAGTPATSLANLLTFITSGSGLFHFLRDRRNKQESGQTPVPNKPGLVRVEYADGTYFAAQTAAVDMARDLRIIREVRDVISPLGRTGVDEFRMEISDPNIPDLVISADDADEMAQLPADSDLPNAATLTLDLEVISPVLTDDSYQWRFSDGIHPFTAPMRDPRFQRDVAAGIEPFTGGDVLRCLVQLNQVQTPTGRVQARYEILQVLEHRRHGRLFVPGTSQPEP